MFVFLNNFSYICYMSIYRFSKYIWCWDITIGDEPYCFVIADNEDEAIRINNMTGGRHYNKTFGIDRIDVVDDIPEQYLKLLVR